MKASDVVQKVKDWWDLIPGWHERLIWFGAGVLVTLAVKVLLA